MLQRLRRRKPFTALDRDFYTSPDDFHFDLELIWYKDWLFVGHDCEVSNPGQYLTVQIGEYPDHRGARPRSRPARISQFLPASRLENLFRGSWHVGAAGLPYHQWTYALDGRLLSARDMGG